jgi:hypothetical protein
MLRTLRCVRPARAVGRWLRFFSTGNPNDEARLDGLDRFYTRPCTARKCVDLFSSVVLPKPASTIIEPSAGSGAFLRCLEDAYGHQHAVVGLDARPAPETTCNTPIEQTDFLHWTPPPPRDSSDLYFVGNPPFGRQSNLALKFITRIASFPRAKAFGFILARSFQKESLQKRIPLDWHLQLSEDLPNAALVTPSGADRNVTTVFQIWCRGVDERKYGPPPEPIGWRFIRRSNRTAKTVCVARVGFSAGAVRDSVGTWSESTHYFIHVDESIVSREAFLAAARRAEYPSAFHVVGAPSISRSEFVQGLNSVLWEDTDPIV